MWFQYCSLAVGATYAIEEFQFFALEPIQSCAFACTFQTDFRREIKDQRQIRTQVALHQLLKLRDCLLVESAASALVGIGCICEAV